MIVDPVLKFEAQGHYVSLRYHEPRLQPMKRGSTRGRVTTFSRRSRKRLLEKTARLDLAGIVKTKPIVFLTLTYGQNYPKPKQAKVHLRTMWKRIARLSPEASGIWRMEFQDRGAPHFHIILFNLPFISKEVVKTIWGEIIGIEYWDTSKEEAQEPFTRIEAIRNPRKAMAYVSKYVAKRPDESSGFNHVPYLTAGENVGRLWGVFNGKALPFAELCKYTIQLSRDIAHPVLWQYKRLMSNQWKFANRSGRFKGASLFVDYVDCWQRAFLWCLLEYNLSQLSPALPQHVTSQMMKA